MYFNIVKVLKPHMLSGCEIGDKKYNANHMHPKMRAHEILNLQEKIIALGERVQASFCPFIFDRDYAFD